MRRAPCTIVAALLALGCGAGEDLTSSQGSDVQNAVIGSDSLYVGDAGDNTIKRFDAQSGAYQGTFVKKGHSPLKGPMGMLVDENGDLLISNQNTGTNKHGEILKHSGLTGEALPSIIDHNDEDAPFAPRGIVLRDDVLFVADLAGKGNDGPSGRLLAYSLGGELLSDLTPDANTEFPGAASSDEFHPRSIVVGPDGALYVSVIHDIDPKSTSFTPANTLAGWILRFSPVDGSFLGIFASDEGAGCAAHLHRPEGLAFGPDGRLYVAAFRSSPTDTDKILIFDSAGACVDQIDLYQAGEARAFAQALLFGPDGFLFVPISNTGTIRRYDVTSASKPFTEFVSAGVIQEPWYLTFGNTDSATLEYGP
jgi:glucose/arabinose dehydrogenase